MIEDFQIHLNGAMNFTLVEISQCIKWLREGRVELTKVRQYHCNINTQ